MADVHCPTCGEPWDTDELHEVADERGLTFRETFADFRTRGCEALLTSHNGNEADPRIAATYQLLGDDVDGASSMLEDLDL